MAVSVEQTREIVTTSGSTGHPIAVYLTGNDLERLAQNEFQSLNRTGISKKDVVQISCTMDRMFMAGMAYYLGLQKIGATTIRLGSGLIPLQWETAFSMKSTVLIGVPSFINNLSLEIPEP